MSICLYNLIVKTKFSFYPKIGKVCLENVCFKFISMFTTEKKKNVGFYAAHGSYWITLLTTQLSSGNR